MCFAAGRLAPTPQGCREDAPEAPVTKPRAQGALNMWTSFHSIITYYPSVFQKENVKGTLRSDIGVHRHATFWSQTMESGKQHRKGPPSHLREAHVRSPAEPCPPGAGGRGEVSCTLPAAPALREVRGPAGSMKGRAMSPHVQARGAWISGSQTCEAEFQIKVDSFNP